MNKPDDGGSYFPETYTDDLGELRSSGGISVRAKFAAQFAAAWIPISYEWLTKGQTLNDAASHANELGLAMADDLIRRLKETQP